MTRVRFAVFTSLALLGLGFASSPAQAATELYLQFDPAVHGSSKEATHASWITVDSYTFGDGSAPAMGASMAATDKGGKAAVGSDKGGLPTKGGAGDGLGEKGGAGDKGGRPMKVTFVTSDMAVLAELKAAVARGMHFKTAILEVRKPGKGSSDYAKITMTDVLVSSMAVRPTSLMSKASGPGAATFALTFVKESEEYSKADATGSRSAPQTTAPAGWDLAAQKAE